MIHKLIEKYNKFTLISLISIISIIGTQLILRLYYLATETEMRLSETIAGIIAPLIVASAVSFYLINLVKKLSAMEKELRTAAGTDPGTYLKSRRALLEAAEDLFHIAHRYKKNLGLILIDIDHFREINHTYGHHRGDMVLRIIGNIINTSKRESDVAGRYGGDEILIVVPEAGIEGCIAFAKKLLNESEKYQSKSDDIISFTISMGISVYNEIIPVKSIEELIIKAEKGLFEAKKKGQNGFCVTE